VNVDWRFARTVAGRVSGQEPFAQSYHVASLEADLLELTSQAEGLVEAETGLVSAAGPARARVTDRLGWVDANLASFERLIRPLLGRINEPSGGGEPPAPAPRPEGWAGTVADALAPVGRAVNAVGDVVGPKVAGAELGALLGWMSSRVLGQYDLLIIEDDTAHEQDWVYYVGPNVLSLEKRYGFAPPGVPLLLARHGFNHPGPVHRCPVAPALLPVPGQRAARLGRSRPQAPARRPGRDGPRPGPRQRPLLEGRRPVGPAGLARAA